MMPAPEQDAAEPAREPAPPPRVWLVLGDKPGDNAQVEVIAPALGWPCERKHVQMREPYVQGKPRVTPSLHHIDPACSDPLEPPWPDLVITIGRRPSMVALWIAEQSRGRTKLVLLGKPSGMMERFDLVIAGAEAQLPPLPNVLPIALPLMRVDQARIAAAAEVWRARLAALPRPLVAFLIGGPTGPFLYDTSVVERLVAEAGKLAEQGGTPYLTTSRRTPASVVAALRARLPAGAVLFAWAPAASDNPYLGLLGLADGFVVTGDSISMMVEIARLGRPLAILDLPTGRLGALDQLRRSLTRLLFAPGAGPGGLRQRLATTLHRAGLLTHTRDFRAFHRLLLERGLAVRAGEPFRRAPGTAPDDLPLVVARIRGLLEPA
jgi:hypothetical protein